MRNRNSRHYIPYMFGGLLICLGVAFLLDQHGSVALEDAWQFWPLLLVVGGAIRIIDPASPRDVMAGCWSVLIGVWLFANFDGWFGMDFGNSWPVLLIGWGISLLLRPVFPDRPARTPLADKAGEENNNAH